MRDPVHGGCSDWLPVNFLDMPNQAPGVDPEGERRHVCLIFAAVI